MSKIPWYQEFFGEDYFRIYGGFLISERSRRQGDQIADLLALPPGSRILDLCCGHGRITVPLARLKEIPLPPA
ncbi:MAG: hypothetical protein HY321_13770 [Armatimonadetes bacterium]|nr:hypothetical protein [Armatimonadota bacterium]